MGDAIDKILERISAYEFLNNIIPGIIYAVLTEKLTPFQLQTNNVWIDLVLCYFVGLIIGRVGSLVVERFLKWRKKLNFASHSEYVEAEQKDQFVREMSMINNMYRTYTSLALCTAITVGFSFIWPLIKGRYWSRSILIVVACIILIVIFSKSYIKQTNYVVSRVKTINKLNKESQIILPDNNDK
jgi:hypothetical protein